MELCYDNYLLLHRLHCFPIYYCSDATWWKSAVLKIYHYEFIGEYKKIYLKYIKSAKIGLIAQKFWISFCRMFIAMNDFRSFRWYNVAEIILFLYGISNNFPKSLKKKKVILMEKKNILMETEHWAESFCPPGVWLCFPRKLLKNPLPFIVFYPFY